MVVAGGGRVREDWAVARVTGEDLVISSAGVLLERSEPLAVLARQLDGARRAGRGAVVLLSGEAGVGKTALARAWSASRPGVRALWGACEALETPRPLGPLV
ncbi:MAG: AAA family ATPase, partial [Solirubrobacterales bacterium]|nr:AAA family ATPase [Solirubrobacterales bacterium]